jgi:choline kinase
MDLYHNLPKDQIYDGKNYDNMYMTTFIQILISNKFQVTPVFINGGWVEIDSPSDLDVDAVKGS